MIKIKGKADSQPEVWGDRSLPLEIETGEGKKKKRYLLVLTKMGKLLLNKG